MAARPALPVLCLLCSPLIAARALATPEEEIRAAFDRFVVAQNAHDPVAVRALLVEGPQFLWITRGAVLWGPDAAIQRFEQLYRGTWSLTPDPARLKIVAVQPDAYQLVVPVTYHVGAAGQPGIESPFLLSQLWVRDARGWRVASLLPIPVSAPPAGPAAR